MVVAIVSRTIAGVVVDMIVSVAVDVLVGTPESTGNIAGEMGVLVETIGTCGELEVVPAFLIS